MEDADSSRLMKAIKVLGLDRNWVLGVAALCAQEIAIRKRLESLGTMPGDQDFQKVAELLIHSLRQIGEKPPDILLSLARAYPSIRGKLVHWGHKSALYDAEVKSIIENTIGLIETLFREIPAKEDVYQLTEALINLSDGELMSKISELNSTQREKVALALIEKYSLLDWNLPGCWEMERKIKRTLNSLIKSLKPEDMASLLNTIIQRFNAVIPFLVMEILGEVAHIPSVLKMLQEKNYINWIVSRFTISESYDSAGINARVIAKIGSILDNSQIERVFQAILTNDQIQYSWSARSSLINFIAMYGKKVDQSLLKKVQENFPPK